jgi:hypothetical protein
VVAVSLSLVIEPEDSETVVLGKSVGDLQSGIIVNDNSIEGVLHYVTGYTGFSSNVDEQSGNFLVLKFQHSEGATTTVEIIGGTSGPVALDEDMIWVGRIEPSDQGIRVVTTLDGKSITKVYSIDNLVLETEE